MHLIIFNSLVAYFSVLSSLYGIKEAHLEGKIKILETKFSILSELNYNAGITDTEY